MKNRKGINIITVLVCGVLLSAGTLYTGKAAGSTEYKSQGKIVFDNNTADTADDVVFDASDFRRIGDMVVSGKNQIGTELNKYPSVNLDLSAIPDFTELAEAIDTLTDDATAEEYMILKDYTAYVKGDKVIGGMENNANTTVSGNSVTTDTTYTYFNIPIEGYYNTDSKIMVLNSQILDSLKEIIDKIKNDAYTQGMNAANDANIGSITTCKNGGAVSNNWVCPSKMAILSCNAVAKGVGGEYDSGRAYLSIYVDGIEVASSSEWCYGRHEAGPSERTIEINNAQFVMTKGQKLTVIAYTSTDRISCYLQSFTGTHYALD